MQGVREDRPLLIRFVVRLAEAPTIVVNLTDGSQAPRAMHRQQLQPESVRHLHGENLNLNEQFRTK